MQALHGFLPLFIQNIHPRFCFYKYRYHRFILIKTVNCAEFLRSHGFKELFETVLPPCPNPGSVYRLENEVE